ncbi:MULTISPECIES: XdhC family protein [Chryseobacterium]|uniref:Xanthine dehydrogenase accessory factor n=1 Tax=Chryseobacterium camelliae TaxID=1265445 RepID=A0ABU0TFR6_9FLAO|nr:MULTISPECIES: XdhC/CoxI family protein [Chryseobacterium]MDT3406295.1 xanthine dehydrogenase accessory factor [Pseudacidovorax intermedius]MDQ1095906.1 xanthine dehydrogenase accessory factor [Chryseobacterium camelliae]MDQ1099843.1 xanthine dehydrogenase accessory factor [Chryseobacterium sp. SORGH_AS_1048]MDR6087189.1 xanthine dehydrogenase accessory factor [Chryseobacterium sp. SORGH_AS_0909]MDR6131562.1 xanthine dehydrogenase accessory factor [Chryseobacterium sp. SORGH_AS_1175]
MKEINTILEAYSRAESAGKKSALATVVKVEGSSYRQPGARMLVTEDGELTGAISGGCLEGDALKKALLAISQRQNKLVTYDTTNEDDAEFGVQLGCNGIVHILFEYIDSSEEYNPIYFLRKLQEKRQETVLVNLFSMKRGSSQPGTVAFSGGTDVSVKSPEFKIISSDIKEAFDKKESSVKTITVDGISYEALIEYQTPNISLVIAGAGNDVIPLSEMAAILGWEVHIGDGRTTHAVQRRFPAAKKVRTVKASDFLDDIVIDDLTFFVLMTHNYQYDLSLLSALLERGCRYIGVLGPKTKLERMLEDLNNNQVTMHEEQLNSIYGPVGLDTGAETAEEIAVSVVSEIMAVLNGRTGTSLKYRTGKIHTGINQTINTKV